MSHRLRESFRKAAGARGCLCCERLAWEGIAVLLAVWATCSQVGAVGAPELRLVQEEDASGATALVQVVLASPTPLGAHTIEVDFDPTQARLVRVDGGTAAEFSGPPLVDRSAFASGHIRLSAFQAARLDGPAGRVHVATLVFERAEPSAPSRFRLAAKVVTLAYTDGSRGSPVAAERMIRLP